MTTPAASASLSQLFLVRRTCLNGWWDFQSAVDVTTPETTVPTSGWSASAYLVPSFWTKPREGLRQPGDKYFHGRSKCCDHRDNDEGLFDAWTYPVAWARSRAGWVRRSLAVAAAVPGRRRWLLLEAIVPRGWLFINGRQVAYHQHPTLPLEVDIEDFLHEGVNEIALRITDHERDARGRTLVPSGNWIPCDSSGVWQDVWLIERGSVRVAEIVISTSTRRNELSVTWEMVNAGEQVASVTLVADVAAWARHVDVELQPTTLMLPVQTLTIPAHGSARVQQTAHWPDAPRWEPGSPQLQMLRTRLITAAGGELHVERFGFREVWIDGPRLMLNGYPLHLFSDWGHKMSPFYYTESWIRQWFGMLRDANLNHTRLHTHPHPRLILDLADEEGILVTNETGMHGSGGEQGADDPRYWKAAVDHIQRFVRRDRNRPSVILWSVENEMRWNGDKTRLTVENLPKMRALFSQLDATRPAFHDGDSSLWSEAFSGTSEQQIIISRHYGKECSGLGWWDRQQPLSSGEMSLYHYSGPNSTLHLAGEKAYADFSAIDEAAAEDTALIVEAGRTLGVCMFGPWNLSCLQNLRPHAAVRLWWPDWTAPGVKPLRVHAQSCEFRFWEGGAGYTPAPGFAAQAHAFRSLAVIDRSLRTGYCPGAQLSRMLHVVNDTRAGIDGELVVSLTLAGAVVHELRQALHLARGGMQAFPFAVTLPLSQGAAVYAVQVMIDGQVREAWTRSLRIEAPPTLSLQGKVAVFGNGSSLLLWAEMGVTVELFTDLKVAIASHPRLLVLERNVVQPHSQQHRSVQHFAAQGGRVLVLEQEVSLFPGVILEGKPVSAAFVRSPGHAALAGLAEVDLRNWGDDSYAQVVADTIVASRCYRKDDGATMLPLLDAGEGGFGHGSLDFTPLFCAHEGRGLIAACQLLVTSKADSHPAAMRLLANLASWLDTWTAPASVTTIIEAGEQEPIVMLAQARAGATIMVGALDEIGLAVWSSAIGVPLRPLMVLDTYQAVRVSTVPEVAGLCHEDGCGIEKWTYASGDSHDQKIGSCFIAPTPDLEAFWETPSKSMLAEMFPFDQKSEPLRAHARTRFLGDEKPLRAVVQGRVRVGAGQVIFDQFIMPAVVRPRFLRLSKRLRANLGVPGPSLLAGDATGGPIENSKGYPLQIATLAGVGDREQFLQDIRFNPERLLSKPVLTRGAWSVLSGEGTFTCPALGERWWSLVIESPVARQNFATNLGVPNPEALTFCDLSGGGEVEFMINGVSHQTVSGSGTVTDIALEAGYNHVLLRWRGAGDTIGIRFRNIMRHPEVEFRFP